MFSDSICRHKYIYFDLFVIYGEYLAQNTSVVLQHSRCDVLTCPAALGSNTSGSTVTKHLPFRDLSKIVALVRKTLYVIIAKLDWLINFYSLFVSFKRSTPETA